MNKIERYMQAEQQCRALVPTGWQARDRCGMCYVTAQVERNGEVVIRDGENRIILTYDAATSLRAWLNEIMEDQ